jgi:hypothetical protein
VRAAVALAFAAAVLAAASPARAQSSADDAEALIRQGTELRRHSQDARALPYFEGAYRLSRNPRTAAQLALVKMALGYCVDAEQLLNEALAVPDHPWIARNRAALEQARDAARKNIGEVAVTGGPDGAQVLVNGRARGTLPLAAPLRLDRGPIELRLQASGYLPVVRSLMVRGGARQALSIALRPASALAPAAAASPAPAPVVLLGPPPATPRVPPRPTSALRPLAWTAAGVAAGSLAFAVVETVIAARRSDDFNQHTGPASTPAGPTAPAPDCQTAQLTDACRQLQDAWQRARTLAIIGYAGAGVFAGASAALFVIAHRHAAAPAAGQWACAPTLRGAGLACDLVF